jgi:hypothetical protein
LPSALFWIAHHYIRTKVELVLNAAQGTIMLKLAKIFFVCLIAASFVGVPLTASAKDRDSANAYKCKSGKYSGTGSAGCKENGGTR